VARVVLGVMGVMAAIGLTFAWYTTEARRKRDHPDPAANPGSPRVIAIAPAKLPALGYLPSDTNIVVGVHVAELMGNAASRGFLAQLRSGPAGAAINSVEQWTGLKREDLDHAILGLKIDDRILPRATLVVQTRQPYEAAKVREALKAGRRTERGKRTLYRFALHQPALDGVLWCAGERTLVVSLLPEDLDEVPLTPLPDVTRFAPPVRKLLTEMGEGTQAWIVGRVNDLQKVLDPQPLPGIPQFSLPGLPKQDREVLAKVRTLGAWLQWDSEVAGRVAIECTDPAAAQALTDYLEKKDSKSFASWLDLSPFNLVWKREGTWSTGQGRTTAEALLTTKKVER
jgi:hypothetical protein